MALRFPSLLTHAPPPHPSSPSVQYDILLAPDPSAKNYTGQLSMTARIMCTTSQLKLNSVGLALSVLALSVNGAPRPPPSLTLQPDQQLVTAAAAAPFQPGDIVTLTLSFSGALSQVNTGLYIASAKAPPYYVIASHFEPTDARRAWPCMDEPALKAVFNISVIKPADAPIVLSNLPLSSRSGPSARERWSFAPAGAVAMSTYLVTIVIGNFSCTTATLPPPLPGTLPPGVHTPIIRVYTVPGAQSQAAVALRTARASIDRMASLLASSFPLPKLDLVAIPDYPSGATEHWGLITFRETTLLLDAAASSRDIERVATVVAHEVAHSWFGNLVTMPWWTELWLNEGFASFWEYEGVQAAYTGWGLWDVMPVADTQRAMSIDLLASALPLIQASVRSGNHHHQPRPSAAPFTFILQTTKCTPPSAPRHTARALLPRARGPWPLAAAPPIQCRATRPSSGALPRTSQSLLLVSQALWILLTVCAKRQASITRLRPRPRLPTAGLISCAGPPSPASHCSPSRPTQTAPRPLVLSLASLVTDRVRAFGGCRCRLQAAPSCKSAEAARLLFRLWSQSLTSRHPPRL